MTRSKRTPTEKRTTRSVSQTSYAAGFTLRYPPAMHLSFGYVVIERSRDSTTAIRCVAQNTVLNSGS
ncbi:hypothetical protein [Nostoc sp. ATCC 53789]|uniref:hypothetical protein n=1 Tax=Nostoc sp. ATCC 53789 TaxID=76335 RepID=UPI0011BFCC4B|nr:hypothetical protein [Nostoc sp. ATCC 53789]QHG20324.1 hypothetical protein GJB62_30830 [Nostoc sp. ATCC 53789]